jgi:hypothetical protein
MDRFQHRCHLPHLRAWYMREHVAIEVHRGVVEKVYSA